MASILIGALVLTGIVVAWFLIHYWQNPQIENPDGMARHIGRCGDPVTMELSLKFDADGKVIDATHWTSGCGYSFSCAVSATELVRGKTPEEILQIDARMIKKSVGGLEHEHMNCATLAAKTLHEAVQDYLDRKKKKADY